MVAVTVPLATLTELLDTNFYCLFAEGWELMELQLLVEERHQPMECSMWGIFNWYHFTLSGKSCHGKTTLLKLFPVAY